MSKLLSKSDERMIDNAVMCAVRRADGMKDGVYNMLSNWGWKIIGERDNRICIKITGGPFSFNCSFNTSHLRGGDKRAFPRLCGFFIGGFVGEFNFSEGA